MNGAVRIEPPHGPLIGTFEVPQSKSIANRLMMLRAYVGQHLSPPGIRDPDDIHVLFRALSSNARTVDVGLTGTAFRFILPYLAMQKGRETVLTGDGRMLQRPVGPLVEALCCLGADISYLSEIGFPPLRINGTELNGGEVRVDGSMSSQYASALLLSAPFMKTGLELHITAHAVSRPYIAMTTALLRQCGAQLASDHRYVSVSAGPVHVPDGVDEPDWSSASYAYLLAALRPDSHLAVPGLRPESIQGDANVQRLFGCLGVQTRFTASGAELIHTGAVESDVRFELTDCPDLAPTLLAACAGLGVSASFKGVHHLAHKESHRMRAMAEELRKLNVSLTEAKDGTWHLSGKATATGKVLHTNNDHRLAMSLAPLCLSIGSAVHIDHAGAVRKSFPDFWEEMRTMMFQVIPTAQGRVH